MQNFHTPQVTLCFFRDPNALAGDNGVFKDPNHGDFSPADKDIKNGMPILYDAEIESFNLNKNPETGVGLGYRWINNAGNSRVNVLAYGYQRDMAKTIELNGTFYGGDLDILTLTAAEVGLGNESTLPVSGKTKKEHGINLWWYQDNFAAFIQYVNQDTAGLKRDGAEVELSYAITNIPHIIALTPVIRYSQLKSHYAINSANIANYPAPSVTWDWKKYDIGVNLDVIKSLRLTVEYAVNDFVRKDKHEDNNELLTTMRWSMSF